MDWFDTQKYLLKLSQRGVGRGLERMHQLMEQLGNPHHQFKAIHVTGTNGKGSVCAMLDSILRASGISTGLYTSPHLMDIRERICVNGTQIPLKSFTRLVNLVRKKAGSLEPKLTYFELLTAVAFCYFAEKKIKLAVLEVGLGGRLDATNVIPPPEACIITNIGLEHTAYLGNTISKIAWEKAGILKKNSVCVTGASGSALNRIHQVANESSCPVLKVIPPKRDRLSVISKGVTDYRSPSLPITDNQSLVTDHRSRLGGITDHCNLQGKFQSKNLGVVLKTIEVLRSKHWTIPDSAVRNGLQSVQWPGRFQRLVMTRGSRPTLLDGAHNPPAVQELVEAIQAINFHKKKCLLIFNTLQDKNYKAMIRLLQSHLNVAEVWIPRLNTPRSCEPQIAAEALKVVPKLFPSVKKMWYHLKKISSSSGIEWILITGSLYLIGDVLMQMSQRSKTMIRISEKL